MNVLLLTKVFSAKAPGRTAKFERFVRYLVSEGCDVSIVTPREHNAFGYANFPDDGIHLHVTSFPSYPVRYLFSSSGRKKVEGPGRNTAGSIMKKHFNTVIMKIISFLKSRTFIFPDNYFDWIPAAVLQAYRIIKRKDIHVLITACFPFSSHIAGFFLKKIFKVSWIAEFRDPWVNNPLWKRTWYVQKLSEFAERALMRNADVVIIYRGWFPGGRDYFTEKYGHEGGKVVELPYLGFDPADFRSKPGHHENRSRLGMIYVGNFYGGDYSPTALLNALASITRKGLVARDEISIKFYGPIDAEYLDLIDRLDLNGTAGHEGILSYEELIPHITGADVGIWIMGSVNSYDSNVPSKVYDYIGAGIPIFGILPKDSVSSKFLESEGLGFTADAGSQEEIENGLLQIIALHRKGDIRKLPDEKRDMFNMNSTFRKYLDTMRHEVGIQ